MELVNNLVLCPRNFEDRILNRNKYQEKDYKFIVNEAKEYFNDVSKGKVYLDKNTLTLVPMLDANNFNNNVYRPDSDLSLIIGKTNSYIRTAAGLVRNPIISIPAWTADMITNIKDNSSLSGIVPSILGQPFMPEYSFPKAGSILGIININKDSIKLEEKVRELEIKRDKINE